MSIKKSPSFETSQPSTKAELVRQERESTALECLRGLLANPNCEDDATALATKAFEFADAFLAASDA